MRFQSRPGDWDEDCPICDSKLNYEIMSATCPKGHYSKWAGNYHACITFNNREYHLEEGYGDEKQFAIDIVKARDNYKKNYFKATAKSYKTRRINDYYDGDIVRED
jgi:hypothetical protein